MSASRAGIYPLELAKGKVDYFPTLGEKLTYNPGLIDAS
jgi:hypothetical protein